MAQPYGSPAGASAAIEVEGVSYTYAGAPAPAVRNLSFSIERGEIFGFLGPSGAGKSTTQKLLIRLLRCTHGRLSVLGRPLESWGAQLFERVGVSFEFPNHFLKLTARENLDYFSSLYTNPRLTPGDLLRLVDLQDAADVRVGGFSKGMQNRLTVARSLLHEPELLFWDEPTAGLDPVNAHRIRELAREQQARGCTIFLTTHDMHTADVLCDRVAFIADGALRVVAPPAELKLKYGHRRLKVEHQAGDGVRTDRFPLENLADDPDFLAILRSNRIRTMHTQEASLDEIFMKVTGSQL